MAMPVRKRKKSGLPEDVPQSILTTERELRSGRKEGKREKSHGIKMLDARQEKGGEDIDKASAGKKNGLRKMKKAQIETDGKNEQSTKGGEAIDKASAKKTNGHRKMKKTQLETDDFPSKNEQSPNCEMEVSELVLQKVFVQPDQVSKVGEAEGQQTTGSARQKSSTQKHLKMRSSDPSFTRVKLWTLNEEIVLLSVIVDSVRPGIDSSVNSNVIDWNQLAKMVSEKLEGNVTRTQVYEKARRLKNKYSIVEQKVNAGIFKSFKKANEEEAYRLYQQIWGDCGILSLHLEEEDADPISGAEKLENQSGDVIISHQYDPKGLKTSQFTAANENQASVKINRSSESIVPSFKERKENIYPNQKERPDRENELRSHAMEGDAERMLEMLSSEHQAFLKKVQNSCQLVLEEMQGKLVAMVSNAVKEAANQVSPWMGGMHMSSRDIFQPATVGPLDDFAGKYIPSNGLGCVKPIESLHKQWQQQHLEELKLTSGRLRLLQEECHLQQEKIEKEMIKRFEL